MPPASVISGESPRITGLPNAKPGRAARTHLRASQRGCTLGAPHIGACTHAEQPQVTEQYPAIRLQQTRRFAVYLLLDGMKTVLVIFFLAVQSSYLENSEVEATNESFDTVQFYAADGNNWRVKTFALDQDVHIWKLGGDVPDLVALARMNTEKHYADVLTEGYIIETDAGLEGVRKELAERGLSTDLEITASGAVFWVPGGSNYATRSSPK